MVPADSPFPARWWGPGLEAVGLGDVRPDRGTYGCSEFARLPPLPFALSGDFAWLAAVPPQRPNIGKKYAKDTAEGIKLLRASAQSLGVRLPEPFTKFIEAPSLHKRVRSATDCYLDLCPEPIRSPLGGGWLVHFLADSQGCLFWYLYLSADGSDHAVVSAPDYYSTPLEWSGDDESDDEGSEEEGDPKAIAFCAESFEAFLCRYWLENEIQFAQSPVETPMPEAARQSIERAARQYVEHYRRQQ